MTTTTLLWFRRDLRLADNRALLKAIAENRPIIAVFIFDTHILTPLAHDDRRISFICQSVSELQQRLSDKHIPLHIQTGEPEKIIPPLAADFHSASVICAEDYEPQAIARDSAVAAALKTQSCQFLAVTDQVLYPKATILTQQGSSYSVFTPYKRAWLKHYAEAPETSAELPLHWQERQQQLPQSTWKINHCPTPEQLGFHAYSDQAKGGEQAAQKTLETFLPKLNTYHEQRDYPAIVGTSNLSPYLRFGCLSIRQLVELAYHEQSEGAQTWLSELIWREFYQQHLYHHPDNIHQSYREPYRELIWDNHPEHLTAWQEGQTGYPIIDAAIRCLKQTGTMHNRLRMMTASFLCKDLLCDWRLGEQWFARYLLDFDLAANNGGWQWAASTGCDAQPYFRVFNPTTQSKKFDPKGQFIRQWLPELAHLSDKAIHQPPALTTYPKPIVDHASQRLRAIALYKQAADAYKTLSN